MAEGQGVPAATEFLDSRAADGFSEIYVQHGTSSSGLPTIGVSDDPLVAEYFARGPNQDQAGFVTVFRMSEADANALANRNYENSENKGVRTLFSSCTMGKTALTPLFTFDGSIKLNTPFSGFTR